LAGHVKIESQARLSGVLGVHQFVHIGRLSMVGGLSRIDRDVPPYMLVEGNPSRVRSLNKIGLERAGLTAEDLGILKKTFRILYRSGYTLNQALEELDLLPENPHLQHLRRFVQQSVAKPRRGLIPGKK
jgi:UDP-N-acetylglucosamine acyltransferase